MFRTIHTAHGGKLSVARVLAGVFQDGDVVAVSGGGEERITGVSRLTGQALSRIPEARAGDCVAFGGWTASATARRSAWRGASRGPPPPSRSRLR